MEVTAKLASKASRGGKSAFPWEAIVIQSGSFMKTYRFCISQKGFTLVELMITLVVTSIISLAIYSAYVFQQRTQQAQEQVVEMQQNIRSALFYLTREMRMAGFDPQNMAIAGVGSATKARFQFTQDFNDNGPGMTPGNGVLDPNETITFGFANADDADIDGIADAGVASLARNIGAGGFQPIADNIQAIEFYYTLESGAKTLTPSVAEYENIRMVTVSILARAAFADRKYRNQQTYITASGANWPVNDNFRRRFLISNIQLRNLSL